ncbi:MAG: Gfo/Idh/MocA family oxidoreductase [Cyclobacteriaceae bacterium]|nr:Gfo/Idh/MocA family oxidoreductase [Cyclobacteriaceae bacterium]
MNTPNRRNFIKQSAGLAASLGLANIPFSNIYAKRKKVAANDKVTLGLVGLRGVNWANLRSHLKIDGVECAALCDVDETILNNRAADLEKMTGKKADLYGDFRKMLERDDIDAILVGTPDHWHTLGTIYAMESGKDVYVEKPLANSIEECLVLEKAVNRYNKVVQVGQQQRSGQHWNDAKDFVQSGKLGKISSVKAFLNYGNSKELVKVPDGSVPEGVDYNMWLGPASKRPFNKNRFHGTWRYFWDYGGGIMTDWGVHLIDMVLLFMDVGVPNSVLSSGGKFTFPNSAMETPDNQIAIYEFDNFIMSWEHTQGIGYWPYGKHHGVAVYGENGLLLIDRQGWEVRANQEYSEEKREQVNRMDPVELQKPQGNSRDLHALNFIDCIKSREKPACDISIGVNTAINAHLGNIAYRLGRKVYWDHDKKEFINDAKANELAKAKYRSPWELPKL